MENWDEPERFLFIENNELYDEFTSQFGSEGEAEVGRMDTYLDIDSLESVVEKLTDTIENGYYLEDRVCHLYGQGMWNDKAFIVANRVALEELRDAINMALSNGEFRLSSSTSDNEPYDLFISCVPSVFDWDNIELPYHDETYFNKTTSPVKAFDKYRYKLK